jgi:flavin reductase (DIM6/NTAB) family NADH-FMN oxidoreductase RutF
MSNSVRSGAASPRETIARVLGRTPSGVFVLTAANAAGQETGMLASWVQQASFEPPMVSVAVNNERYLNEWFREVPRAVLNLLGDSHTRLLRHFARGFAPDAKAFDGVEIGRSERGLPVLNAALGYLEGSVAQLVAAGDHTLVLLEIVAAGAGPGLDTEAPMVHIRKNGFKY